MVNDITTLNGALAELGELMANNLKSKGISASAEDGLTTLANKITDITPFLMLSSDKDVIKENETCTLIAFTPHIATGGVLQGEKIDIVYETDDEDWDIALEPEEGYYVKKDETLTLNLLVTNDKALPEENIFIKLYIED